MGKAALANGTTVARSVGTGSFPMRMTLPLSVRAHVVGLILVIVTPLLAFGAALVLRSAVNEQDVMANSVRERTRAAASDRSSAWIAPKQGARAGQLAPSPGG